VFNAYTEQQSALYSYWQLTGLPHEPSTTCGGSLVVAINLFTGHYPEKLNTGGNMEIIDLIIFLAVGALVGWLAGLIVKGRGFGLIGNMIVGIIGAVVGGFVFGLLGITTGGLLGSIVMATIGAIILLYIISVIKKV